MKLYAFAAYIEGELPGGFRAAHSAIYKNQFAIAPTRKIENFKELLERILLSLKMIMSALQYLQN